VNLLNHHFSLTLNPKFDQHQYIINFRYLFGTKTENKNPRARIEKKL